MLVSGAACGRHDADAFGAAADALVADYCLLDVHTDEETVHVEGPDWLLASVEGAGPMKLDLRVQTFLIPRMTTTGNCKPKKSAVSMAVGYSMEERYGVSDFSRLDVTVGAFQRIEAYPNFRRTVFEIHDANCGVLLGMGAAYRPIGVYFRAVYASDVALPDVGVRVCVPVADPPLPIGAPPPEPEGVRDGG
jgi:hypothetical protein